MPIKTIVSIDYKERDKEVNEFIKSLNKSSLPVRTNTFVREDIPYFEGVIFYDDPSFETIKEEVVINPDSNKSIKWGVAWLKDNNTFAIKQEGSNSYLPENPDINIFEKKGENYIYENEAGNKLFFLKNKYKKTPNQPDYIIYPHKEKQ